MNLLTILTILAIFVGLVGKQTSSLSLQRSFVKRTTGGQVDDGRHATRSNNNNNNAAVPIYSCEKDGSGTSISQEQQHRQHRQHRRHGKRREFLGSLVGAMGTVMVVDSHNTAHAIRAVGGGEVECRIAGNCLEKGEWDGAIGWTWGGKDRCDPIADPTCGVNGGKIIVSVDENGNLIGQSVPINNASQRITHVAILRIDIGREESNILRLGLYGNDAPIPLIQQMIDFLSNDIGLTTMTSSNNNNNNNLPIGTVTSPVILSQGGVATWVTPGSSIEFGIPSQANAYARSRGGSSKLLDSFVPQPRPVAAQQQQQQQKDNDRTITASTTPSLFHSSAGLLSVSKKGLGYGGTGYETDDECYERTFLITDGAIPAFDKTRQVIGQVLDGSSMAYLERLANLPTKRGIRGVLPGQTDGPPLPRVVIRDVAIAKVVNQPSTTTTTE